MLFSTGDILQIDGQEYRVVGKITYRNTVDNCCWDEYRILSVMGNMEAWLSIDEVYKEYSISRVVFRADLGGYHEVDRGREIAMSVYGDVDVEVGDSAYFAEYEDITEEKIVSEEVWDDGTEYSEGYYLDVNEINLVRNEPATVSAGSYQNPKRVLKAFKVGIVIVVVLIIFIPILVSALDIIISDETIADYLEENPNYTYSTSITGHEQQKADVYEATASNDVGTIAKDIIDAIEGETEYVQEDTEDSDGSVAILTDEEYCIVYRSEEGSGILVQISDRKYAYTSDNDLYHGTQRSRRYYRRFYYSTGYTYDMGRYNSYSSPYSSYSDVKINYNSANTYNIYSGSVRQSSVGSRSSSGGGLSGGK